MSMALTAIIKKAAAHTGLVTHPSQDRYKKEPVPLGGGIAIFTTLGAAIIGAIIIAKLAAEPGYLDWLGGQITVHVPGFLKKTTQMLIMLAAGAVLFATGLWDDRKPLGPLPKLVIQFAAAITVASLAGMRVELFIENKVITTALSSIWIVLIINIFNFLDNMDGASAGIAIIVSTYLLIAAIFSGQVFVAGLAIVLIGALAGFLAFNFPPAKIFMGDAGSLVTGYFVALLTLRTTYYNQAHSGRWYSVLLPLVVLAVPLYDFISVNCLRIIQGKNPLIGDTQHFSHRLKKRGLTETQTVLMLYLATLCTGLGATFIYQVNLLGAILILAQTFLILAIIAILEITTHNEGTS